MAVEEQRRKQLAMAHIAKNELGLSDEEYRDIIGVVAPGKASCSDLSQRQLSMLLFRFRELGWRPQRQQPQPPFPPLVWKARSLWLELYNLGEVHHPSWSALGHFAKRVTGVANLRRLDSYEAAAVVEELKRWLLQAKGKRRHK